jgi:hypothetical protein
MTLEVSASCQRLSCEVRIQSTILNQNPSSSQWNDKTTLPRMKKFKSAPSTRKVMVVVFWDKRSVILVNILPQTTIMNSDHYTETLRNLYASPWVHSTRNMPEMLLLHNNITLHTSVCTTEAITTCGWTVHSLYSPDLASSDYRLFEPLKKKKKPARTSLCKWWGTENTVC